MATLTNERLALMRRAFVSAGNAVDFTKPDINGAFQAVEDHYEAAMRGAGVAKTISTAIDDAVTFRFATGQKREIERTWQKFNPMVRA